MKDKNLVLMKTLDIRLKMVGMWNFQDNFETHKPSFISAFSICMTVLLKLKRVDQIN